MPSSPEPRTSSTSHHSGCRSQRLARAPCPPEGRLLRLGIPAPAASARPVCLRPFALLVRGRCLSCGRLLDEPSSPSSERPGPGSRFLQRLLAGMHAPPCGRNIMTLGGGGTPEVCGRGSAQGENPTAVSQGSGRAALELSATFSE